MAIAALIQLGANSFQGVATRSASKRAKSPPFSATLQRGDELIAVRGAQYGTTICC